MNLLDKIKKRKELKKKKPHKFGDVNETMQKQTGKGQGKAWVLINGAKEILQEEVGLTNLWFKDNAWDMRQMEIAVEMVKEKNPDFWLKILVWCLNHPTDPFARRIRNLRPLIKYMSYYLDDVRWKKHKNSESTDSRMRQRKGKQYLKDRLKKY